MRRIALILVAFGFVTACSLDKGYEAKNVELINNYVTAVENLEYDAMASYLDDNYIGLGPSINDSINKVQAIESWQYNTTNLYESVKYNRSRSIAITIPSGPETGEWVSNWAELTINYKTSPGAITIWANTIYQIDNGKIVKSYTFYNEADALRQLGYTFTNLNDQ